MSNAAYRNSSVEAFKASLRPEAELLLLCARLALRPAERERILQLLESDLDWACLLELAARHGLRPLLYRHLNALAPAAVPKAIFVELWSGYERACRRNQAMAQELLRILNVLDSNAIAAIPYKGPALAASVYGDPALREYGDLDILLRLEDVIAAKALLLAQGYRPKYALEPAVEAAFLRSNLQYHLVLVHGASSITVELHWMTDPAYPVERAADAQWWANLDIANLGQGKVRSFSVTELLLILCLHGSKHYWTSLGWLVDVAELMRQHPDTDWDWILSKANALACERRLALGLHLAQRLLDAPLPQAVQRRIAAVHALDELTAMTIGTLFTPEFHEWNTVASLRLNLKLYERPRQKLDHLLNVVFAPSLPEWSRWPLPRAFHFLYLPLRLIRLLGKYGRIFPNRP